MKLNYTYLAKMLIDGNKSEAILLWIICNIEIDLVHLYCNVGDKIDFLRQ